MHKASRIWNWLFALTLVLLCTGAGSRLLHRAGGEAVWPLENGIRWLWRGVSTRAVALWRAQETVARLRRLEDEVEQLRIDARSLEDLAAENRELRQSLGLPPRTVRQPLKCEVISWGGAAGWWRSLKINRGATSGVREGDAVVCADGLVGRVKKVYSDASDVQLITDANSRISCSLVVPDGVQPIRGILQGKGWNIPAENGWAQDGREDGWAQDGREDGGIIGGSDGPTATWAHNPTPDLAAFTARALLPSLGDGGEGMGFLFVAAPLRLDYLDRATLESGILSARIRVVTSGLSGSIPGGIPVGWLVSAQLDGDGLYGIGSVVPAVDFSSVRTMAVLVGEGGSR